MSYLEAALLGILQALTEFLPVSSSGHLVLAERWFAGSAEVDVFFNVLLHVGTMAAVVAYFRREIVELIAALFGGQQPARAPFSGGERRAVLWIVLANVPTAVIGLLFDHYLEEPMSRPAFVGAMLIATGFLLWRGRKAEGDRGIESMTAVDALVIGVAQGIAVLPGISRSGATIVVAMLIGLRRDLAAKFSLLISIPAIVGATLLEAVDIESLAEVEVGPYVVGMLLAGAVGYGSVHLILLLVDRHQFYRFAFYVWPLGIVALLSALR